MPLINICKRCNKIFEAHDIRDDHCALCTLKAIDAGPKVLEAYKKRKEREASGGYEIGS
jgi:hypothetical protein